MADKKKAIGLGVLALLGLGALFASKADADDDVGPPDPEPDDDVTPVDIIDPPPSKPAGAGITCNYVGCAQYVAVGAPVYDWPYRSEFPNYRSFGLALEQLGYVQNPPPASPAWNVTSQATVDVVKDFQTDFNVVRAGASGTFKAEYPALVNDGLIGNRTIAALRAARSLQQSQGKSWEQIVNGA